MRSKVIYRNSRQSYMTLEDWVEFSTVAMKMIEEGLVGRVLTTRNAFATIPGLKEVLALVKLYP